VADRLAQHLGDRRALPRRERRRRHRLELRLHRFADQRHARERHLWIAIATQAGSTHDEDFPGIAALVDPDGEVRAELPDWREGTLIVDVPL